MAHHGNIGGDSLGALDLSQPTNDQTRAIRMRVLSSLPTIPEGAPAPLGDVTPACILAMSLYGETSPGLPPDIHPAIYQHCA